jgi:hypothetical protein
MLCFARDAMDEEYRKHPGVVRSKKCGTRNQGCQGEFFEKNHPRCLPGMMKKIRVGTSKYTITAYMNNRMYSTCHEPTWFF